MRTLLAFLLCAGSLGAQSVSIRLGTSTTAPDTVYLTPEDSIPLRLVGRTASGGTVTPTNVTWVPMLHCVTGVYGATTASVVLGEAGCGYQGPGYLVALGTVSGVIVKDSVYVMRPSFTFGSALAACLSAGTGTDALRYAARDSALVLALQGEKSTIIAVSGPAGTGFPGGTVNFGWQIGTKTVPFRAVACQPGYRATDVTTSSQTSWLTDATSIAAVSKGVVTWKTPQGFRIVASWRGYTASWELR